MQQTNKSQIFQQQLSQFGKLLNYEDLKQITQKKRLNPIMLSETKFSTAMDQSSEDFFQFKKIFQSKNYSSLKLNKSLGVFIGLLLGDSLGAFTEFLKLDINRIIIKLGYNDLKKAPKKELNKRKNDLPVGCHTDDCAMAKCLAESLIANNLELNSKDCRQRFLLWWELGYCNGLCGQQSIGLGGSIKIEMDRYLEFGTQMVNISGERNENGCGSIMRLAPCALSCLNDLKKTIEICSLSSLTTHNGIEAEECCKLLGLIIQIGVNSEEKNTQLLKNYILDNLEQFYEPYRNKNCISIQYLARSQMETEFKQYPPDYNQSKNDRNWNWKNKDLFLAPSRLQNIGYYGSYCMDCMYIALHIIYITNSFKEALFMAANMGGDCDSFGAVVGQIAGAIYGLDDYAYQLYQEKPLEYDNFHTPYLAYRIYMMQK